MPFEAVDYITWRLQTTGETANRPIFASKRNNDILAESWIPGLFFYERRDAAGNVTQRVWLSERGVGNESKQVARIEAVEGPVADGTGHDWSYLGYRYDDQDQLNEITTEGGNSLVVTSVDNRITKVSFNSSEGVREVTYTYEVGRLSSAKKAGHEIRYTYADTDPDIGTLATITDVTRQGEVVLSLNDWDLESRAGTLTPEGKANLEQTLQFDRLLGTATKTYTDGNGGQVTTVTRRDGKKRLIGRETSAMGDPAAGQQEVAALNYEYYPANELAGPSVVRYIARRASTAPDSVSARRVESMYTYDAAGNVTSHTNGKGQTTYIDRGLDNTDGLPIEIVTDAKSRSAVRKFDNKGRLVAVYRRVTVDRTAATPDPVTGEPRYSFSPRPGYITYYTYDVASGGLAGVEYDSSSLRATYPWITSQNEKAVLTNRNQFGQAESAISPAGYETRRVFDGLARLRSVQPPSAAKPTTVGYHESGLAQDTISRITTAGGEATQQVDVAGRSKTVTDSRGVSTSYLYNEKGQITRIVEVGPAVPHAMVTQYQYNELGELRTKYLPNGTRVDFGYDGFGRMVSMTEIEGPEALGSNNLPEITAGSPAAGTSPILYISGTRADTFTSIVRAADADVGDTLNYELVQAPEGVSFNTNTGELSWTPSANQVGNHTVTVLVTDGHGGADVLTFTIAVTTTIDTDGDGVYDHADNCPAESNPSQLDSDGDGPGNRCDTDINNDGVVNFADLALFKAVFNTSNEEADFDSNGTVDTADLVILKGFFGTQINGTRNTP